MRLILGHQLCRVGGRAGRGVEGVRFPSRLVITGQTGRLKDAELSGLGRGGSQGWDGCCHKCSGTRACLLCGMRDLPRPGLEPVSPALAGKIGRAHV